MQSQGVVSSRGGLLRGSRRDQSLYCFQSEYTEVFNPVMDRPRRLAIHLKASDTVGFQFREIHESES